MTQKWEHTDDPVEGVCMVRSVLFAPIIAIHYKGTHYVVIPHF